jgi:hypothetical protein
MRQGRRDSVNGDRAIQNGDIAWSTSFWPVSTTNIAKGDSFPFDYPVDQVRKPVDVTTRVERFRTW